MDQWIPVITESLDFAIMTEVSPTKGNLVYEYNPLRNYRLQYNMYFFNNIL